MEYGVVTRIEPLSLEGDHQLGLGTVVGAAAGGVIGHQIGGGTGRDVATVVGAIGGGLAGNAIDNRYVDRRPGQQIFVRLDNGKTVAVTQPGAESALHRVGERVMVKGSDHRSPGRQGLASPSRNRDRDSTRAVTARRGTGRHMTASDSVRRPWRSRNRAERAGQRDAGPGRPRGVSIAYDSRFE